MLYRTLLCNPLLTSIQKYQLLAGDSSLEAKERELLRRIKSRICTRDTMYTGNGKHYYKVGLSAIRCIDEALRQAKVEFVQSILDLPCGYGRVLRFLVQRFPEAKSYACDIERKAVDFCTANFGAVGAYSRTELSGFSLDTQFDLIWCGSLITHLDSMVTLDLLKFFRRHLSPGGVLIFTTLGNRAVERMLNIGATYRLRKDDIPILITSYAQHGYGYVDYPGQCGYGISVTSPDWIRGQLQQVGGWQEVYFGEQSWDNHQDVFGFMEQA